MLKALLYKGFEVDVYGDIYVTTSTSFLVKNVYSWRQTFSSFLFSYVHGLAYL